MLCSSSANGLSGGRIWNGRGWITRWERIRESLVEHLVANLLLVRHCAVLRITATAWIMVLFDEPFSVVWHIQSSRFFGVVTQPYRLGDAGGHLRGSRILHECGWDAPGGHPHPPARQPRLLLNLARPLLIPRSTLPKRLRFRKAPVSCQTDPHS